MKTRILSFVLLSGLLLTGCGILNQMGSLLTCKYDLGGVADPRIAGISLTNVADVNNLGAMDLVMFTAGLLAGQLPLSATVNIDVTNPNASAAQLAGLEWALFFDNTSVVTGTTTHNVYVAPNGGRTVVPFTVQMNVLDFFKKDSKDDIFKFVNGVLHMGEQGSRVALKIRPSISIGGQVMKTGFITVQKNI